VLRNSSRTLKLRWHPQFAFGRYTATTDLLLHTPMGELTSEPIRTVLWVIPLLLVLIILLVIFLVSFVVQVFFSRFEIRAKKRSDGKGKGKGKYAEA
jgi:hypothetical protein